MKQTDDMSPQLHSASIVLTYTAEVLPHTETTSSFILAAGGRLRPAEEVSRRRAQAVQLCRPLWPFYDNSGPEVFPSRLGDEAQP